MTIDPVWDSYVRRTGMLDEFGRFLRYIAIFAVAEVILCIWEFTYGIKKSVKQLRNKLRSGVHDDH